jgi:hypothetical protein
VPSSDGAEPGRVWNLHGPMRYSRAFPKDASSQLGNSDREGQGLPDDRRIAR